jgi:CHAT domain
MTLEKITILILTANPRESARLRLDQEVKEIEEGLRRSKERDRFIIQSKWAVSPRDIRRALLDEKPQIIHFSGHGEGEEGLIFEDGNGGRKSVDAASLESLFKFLRDNGGSLECVILNACYSVVQAEVIARHVNYVIGMDKAIGDTAAIEFAVGFYDGLGAGLPITSAYNSGCVAIQMSGIREHLTPKLIESA